MTNRLLAIWSALVLVPAVPVIAFYLLFSDQNYFELKHTARGIVATGPIAAYVALVLIGWSVYRRVSAITGDISPMQAKILGTWRFTATSFHGTTRQGVCQIEEDRGRLCVSGNFQENGKNVGSWSSTMAQLDREQLEVLYRLDEFRAGEQALSTGVLSVHVDPSDLSKMSGNWVVLGRSEAHGDMVLTPAK